MFDDSNDDVPTLERTPNGRRRLGQLLITKGPGLGQRFEVEQTLTLGRSDEFGIPIDDVGVSRAHATVSLDADGAFQLEDLQSRNGTHVNEARIQKRLLRHGDKIRLGPGVELEFREFEALDGALRERHRREVIGSLSSSFNAEAIRTLTALRTNLTERTVVPERERNAEVQALNEAATHALAFSTWLAVLCAGRDARQSFDLSTLVRNSGPWLQRWLGEQLKIEIQADGVVFVHGYQADILLALLDLCADAAATTPPGGSLSVQVTASTGTVGGPGAALAVAHTRRAPRPLGEQPGSDRQESDATLALAFVREVANLHGAELRATTEQPTTEQPATQIATLCFPDTLPAEFRQANTVEFIVPAPKRKPRLLLAQSDPIVRRMTARLLRDAHYEVTEYGAAHELLDRALALPPSLAVVDAQLPDMAGATVLAHITARHPTVPGLLLDENPLRRNGSELPPAPFAVLHKPFTFDELVTAIEHALA